MPAPVTDAPRMDEVVAAAKAHAPDHYAAALLAPAGARADLVALAAYLGEVRRIPLVVRDVTLALIRLQWWRDVVAASAAGGRTGNPVADAVVDVIRRRDLPLDLALQPLDAAEAELATDQLSDAAFAAYLDAADGAAFRMAVHVLGCAMTDPEARRVTAAGRASAAAHLATAMPFHVRCGRLPAAQSYLAGLADFRSSEAALAAAAAAVTRELTARALAEMEVVRHGFGDAPPAIRAALLPVALVPSYLNAVNRPGRNLVRDIAEISPIGRMWRLWLAHKRARV